MKYGDVQNLHDAGLITNEQRRKIIEHFQLKEDGGGKFLAIVSIVGAVLIAAGIALLIAAHWDEIPRGVKIAAGLLLMLGAHGLGWWLRNVRQDYLKTGEALHFLGSCLFLANIALLGQIYNLVSRPPNAFLLWWVGIAALPWLLRSKAQHVLLLLAFGIWFGFEVNERGSFICCDSDYQVLLYALLGFAWFGVGLVLRRGRFADFAGVTEKFGLLIFLAFFYPLTWKDFFEGGNNPEIQKWVFPLLALVALAPLAAGIKNLGALTLQWRWTWFAAFFGMVAFMATVWLGCWQLDPTSGPHRYFWGESWNYLVGILALFVFCLLQIQVGLQERSRFLVNLGVVFIALDILAAYCDLFGSMARTGVMFLVSGIFLIVFGVYLEKKRRKLMKQIQSQTTGVNL
ncbi:MAG TPA: DUF2157 domain-containing protein [Candidatus Acidoferrum sp.]|nr:DUF2157 domain-containing protein [Candidatus Acidoferrum sp.]